MKKLKLKNSIIKFYLMQFVAITLILYSIAYIIISSVKINYYEHINRDVLNLSKSYSQKFSKALEAKGMINEFLNQKLDTAIKTASLFGKEYDNEFLKQLAGVLSVDEIDYYDSNGQVIYSNIENNIGWKAPAGHPVHNFMTSGSISQIDEVRQDSVSGEYYKYGYIKVSDKDFIQIGVKANKVHDFLKRFEIQELLGELIGTTAVSHILYIDNDFNIIERKNDNYNILINDEIKNHILRDEEYSYMDTSRGKEEYLTFTPVFSDGNKLGALVVVQQLDDINKVTEKINMIILRALIIIYALIFFSMLSSYKKDKKLINDAYYYELTSLPNKRYLKEVISNDLKSNESNKMALLLVNIRNMSLLSNMYGYEHTDKLIKMVGEELKGLNNEHCGLFQLLLEKFVLYLDKYNDDKDLSDIINRINDIFNKPFKTDMVDSYVQVQIGVAKFDKGYKSYDQILKEATISISHIKDSDTVNYIYYNDIMETKIKREELIIRDIKELLAGNYECLFLEYQPLFNLKADKITGFEVLARMKTDDLGIIPPNEFINIAEENQLIVPLGRLILLKACRFLKKIINEGYENIELTVNISILQLLDRDFINKVTNIIEETKINPSSLCFEITESVFSEDYAVLNDVLKSLRDYGIKIYLDDFGTGYSSFFRLEELNIDVIKIDKSFVEKISGEETKDSIVEDIVSMARKIGLKAVAEGVENKNQLNYLHKINCDIAQGFYLSRPLPEEKAFDLLINQSS